MQHFPKNICKISVRLTFQSNSQHFSFSFFIYIKKKIPGKPFAPHLILNNVIANIICHLVFGHRFEYDDKNFGRLLTMFDSSFEIEASVWAQVQNMSDMDVGFKLSPYTQIYDLMLKSAPYTESRE